MNICNTITIHLKLFCKLNLSFLYHYETINIANLIIQLNLYELNNKREYIEIKF